VVLTILLDPLNFDRNCVSPFHIYKQSYVISYEYEDSTRTLLIDCLNLYLRETISRRSLLIVSVLRVKSDKLSENE